MHQRLIAVVVVATVMCVAGCQKKTEAPPAEEKAQAPVDSFVVAPLPLTGTWTVIAYYVPEAGAMSQAEADAWIGRTLRMSATEFVSGDVHCGTPSYSRITMARDDLLGMDVGFPPGALRRLADIDPLTLVNVSCDGQPLSALGRMIIEVDADHILAPMDGMFFELARDAPR